MLIPYPSRYGIHVYVIFDALPLQKGPPDSPSRLGARALSQMEPLNMSPGMIPLQKV